MRLSGKVAVVTGASRGIGEACARALAAEGASLGLVARGDEALQKVARSLESPGTRVVALAGDAGDEELAARAFARFERELGPVSILVNNAGALEVAPLAQMTAAQWDQVQSVNLRAPFLWSREAVRRMVPRHEGRIVFVSSISGSLGTPNLSAYCASKWGVNGLVKSLAEELSGTGVIAVGVAPGSVDTQMLKRSGFAPEMKPEDVATVVRFLCTEAPLAMQGSIVEIFGP